LNYSVHQLINRGKPEGIEMERTKSYCISKHVVKSAFDRVKANKGSSGVDQQSIEQFERDLKKNIYKIWNRMSSGSYFPPAVKEVSIPKRNGGKRTLGIPTVGDRVAQMTAKIYLEPELEKYFHRDSYGYRPGKSALDALAKARERCWMHDWVIDVDIKGFFDNINHELMLKALDRHCKEKWVRLYVERWLKADVNRGKGLPEAKTKGTPQGGVISPLLANLFLHYTLDKWMDMNCPANPFERYADDIIIHCRTEEESKRVMKAIILRLKDCGLDLNQEKTKIVYCKDDKRKGKYPVQHFDFLGYRFRPRSSRTRKGQYFTNFSPAISPSSKKKISEEMKRWRIHAISNCNLKEIADHINPKIRGWINYYGRFYKSELYRLLARLDYRIIRWCMTKYKIKRKKRAVELYKSIKAKEQALFAHWNFFSYYYNDRIIKAV